MPIHSQKGFTLVELMVAMAIGTVIILGAGQLFLTTLQTFDKVKELSRKQETVVFATTVLVNEYRKTERKDNYSLAETTGNPDECSIRALASDSSGNTSQPRPVVGGLAPSAKGNEPPVCDSNRFMEMISLDDATGSYRRFTLDFRREDNELESEDNELESEDNELETLSFHVMERRLSETADNNQKYQIGTGDAVIAGGALSGVDSNLLQGESQTSNNLLGHNIPSPQGDWPANHTGYIENFKDIEGVVATCDPSVISSSNASRFYCNSSISGLSVVGLDEKIIVAESDVMLDQSDNASVSDLAVVAGGEVTVNGKNSNGVEFGGVIWSAGSSALQADNVDFQGSVVAGGAVTVHNASSISADWNTWDLLSVPGYEFSMADQFNNLGTQINVAETR